MTNMECLELLGKRLAPDNEAIEAYQQLRRALEALEAVEVLDEWAAELTAFALSLRLVSKLKLRGHTDACARLQVFDNRGCTCCKDPP